MAGRFGAWREFLGSKNIFFCRDIPSRNTVNFFLTMARNYTFWREFVVFGETRLALARKNLEELLAGVYRQGKLMIFFLAGVCTAKDIDKTLGLSRDSIIFYAAAL